jgi:hypothetical protein
VAIKRALPFQSKAEVKAAPAMLYIRLRSTFARVLDAQRKFLDAAVRYLDLSQTKTTTTATTPTTTPTKMKTDEQAAAAGDSPADDDAMECLQRAVTCAILAVGSLNLAYMSLL